MATTNIQDLLARGGIALRIKKDGSIDPESLASLDGDMDRVLEKMGLPPEKRAEKKKQALALLTREGGLADSLESMALVEQIASFAKLFEGLKTSVDKFVAKVSQRPGVSPKTIVDLGESVGMLIIAGGILGTAGDAIHHAIACGCQNGEHGKDDASSEVKA